MWKGWGSSKHSAVRRDKTSYPKASQTETQTRRESRAQARDRPAARAWRSGAARGRVTWAAQPSLRCPYKDLGKRAPPLAVPWNVRGGRPTGQAHPFANRKGGKKSLHERGGIKRRKLSRTITRTNHYTIFYVLSRLLYNPSRALVQNCTLLAHWQLPPPVAFLLSQAHSVGRQW